MLFEIKYPHQLYCAVANDKLVGGSTPTPKLIVSLICLRLTCTICTKF